MNKLSRKEQKDENESLDLFVDFALDFAEELERGAHRSAVDGLTDKQIMAFDYVKQRLTRYSQLSLAVTKESLEKAGKLKNARIFKKIEQIKKSEQNFTAVDAKAIREAHEFIRELRQLARDRAANLKKGRKKLSTSTIEYFRINDV